MMSGGAVFNEDYKIPNNLVGLGKRRLLHSFFLPERSKLSSFLIKSYWPWWRTNQKDSSRVAM